MLTLNGLEDKITTYIKVVLLFENDKGRRQRYLAVPACSSFQAKPCMGRQLGGGGGAQGD